MELKMPTKTSVVSIFMVIAALATASAAGVLYTLTSPNEELTGEFGNAVADVGDVNQDGYADVVVGAHRDGIGGMAYVFSGYDGSVLHVLESLSPGFDRRFGGAVSGAGDINSDGYPDIIVGARKEDSGSSIEFNGRVYIFSGVDGTVMRVLDSMESDGKNFGASVSDIGDVNNDGFPDVIVGATGEAGGKGRVYVISVPTGEILWSCTGNSVYEYIGYAVSGAGDVNGDGHPDLIVGCYDGDPGGLENAGEAYVYDVVSDQRLYTLTSPNGEEYGDFGCSVSDAGDLDGDGRSDLLVGARYEGSGGRAYAFSGATAGLLHTFSYPQPGKFGSTVSSLGDLDGDGRPEIIVGAYSVDTDSIDAGRAFIFSGASGDLLYTLESPNETTEGYFGVSISGAGDVNNDGFDDVVVGAPGENPGGSPRDAGRAYIFDLMGVSAEPGTIEPLVSGLRLVGPYPNPTSGRVEISLEIQEEGQRRVDLSLYDITGRRVNRVLSRELSGGSTVKLTWVPKSTTPSGVYWWRLSAGDKSVEKAMVIVR